MRNQGGYTRAAVAALLAALACGTASATAAYGNLADPSDSPPARADVLQGYLDELAQALTSPLAPLVLGLVLLVLLIVILMRKPRVLTLSGEQAESISTTTASIATLQTKVDKLPEEMNNLLQKVEELSRALSAEAEKRAASEEAVRDALEALRRAAVSNQPRSQSAPTDTYPASESSPDPVLSFSDSPAGAVYPSPDDSLEIGSSAAGNALQSDGPSGNLEADYNRAVSLRNESWFAKHYQLTPISWLNIEARANNRPRDLRLVEDVKGNFIKVNKGGINYALPSFRIDYGLDRKWIEGIFTYTPGSRQCLIKAAKLLANGNEWVLDDPGEIENV